MVASRGFLVKSTRRKDGQFRSGGLLVGDRPFFSSEHDAMLGLSKPLTVGLWKCPFLTCRLLKTQFCKTTSKRPFCLVCSLHLLWSSPIAWVPSSSICFWVCW